MSGTIIDTEGESETRSSNTSLNPFIRYKNDTKAVIHGEVGTVNEFQTEEKVLQSGTSTTGIIADLTFTNLIIGAKYEVNLQAYIRVNTVTQSVGISIMNGATLVGTASHKSDDSGIKGSTCYSTIAKFTATSTTLTFEATTATNGSIYGNNTKAQTYVQVTRATEYDVGYVAMGEERVKEIRSVYSSVEKVVGEWIDGKTVYEKTFALTGWTSGNAVDSTLTLAAITPINDWAQVSSNWRKRLYVAAGSGTTYSDISVQPTGLLYQHVNASGVNFTIQYTKN